MLSEDTFRDFVRLLDQSQGYILHPFSKAASDIVDSIFRGTLDPSRTFIIEYVERTRILEQPKGSPELLKLLHLNQTPPLPDGRLQEG